MYQTQILRSRSRGVAASTSWSTLCPQAQPAHQARTNLHAQFLKTAPLLSRPSSGWSWSTTRTGSGPSIKSLDRLSGRTCMITGGTSGIGFAIAERFLQEGAKRIILVGRSHDRLVKAASKLEAPTSGNGLAFLQSLSDSILRGVATKAPETDQLVKAASKLEAPASGNGLAFLQSGGDSTVREVATKAPGTDQLSQNKDTRAKANGTLIDSSSRISLLVGDISEAGTWLRELEKAMQPVDILVNAAGISVSSILAKVEPDDISRVLRTNLEGAMLASRALIRASIRSQMKARNYSSTSETSGPSKCIINISSLLALKGGTGAVPYAASKAGILGLTRSLAVEAAHALRGVVVRSNAIVPGYIETPMIANFSADETSRLKDSVPLRRFGTAHEVADAAVFLAQNEYANNCVLNLDGGLSAV